MRAVVAGLAMMMAAGAAVAGDLQGHGGPVSALAAAGDVVVSGSFDTRAIVWDLGAGTALRVLRHHEGNVSAVALGPEGPVTGGQDGRVVIWPEDASERAHALHQAPVAALAVLPDGGVASASWDGTIALTGPDGAVAARLSAHEGKVTGLGLLEGRLASVGEDLRLRLWDGSQTAAVVDLPAQPNAMAAAGPLAAVAFADGVLRLVGPDGVAEERFLSDRPLIAVAAQGGRMAASDIAGQVWLLNGDAPAQRLEPGQGPIWSLAFAGDRLLTGGADGRIRAWSAETGSPLAEAAALQMANDEGPLVWRACAACHTLGPDDGNRAGPTLYRVMGRRAGTVPDYDYSPALRETGIIWTEETIAALFTQGPHAYTPGSRMPDQRIPNPEDLDALVAFLSRNGR